MSRFREPEPLAPGHAIATFDCGRDSLNRWLVRHALQAASAGSAKAYVVHDALEGRVVGYHALAATSISQAEATPRAAKGMPRAPVPSVLLARLAVDVSVQGKGIGAWLLRDAMLRTLAAAETVGVRVLLVHAIDDSARRFYEHHGFEPSPTDPLNLQLLTKDIRAALEEA